LPAKILELHRPFSDKALVDADDWLSMPSEHPEALADAVAELARKKHDKIVDEH
jgi:hypothetical protein